MEYTHICVYIYTVYIIHTEFLCLASLERGLEMIYYETLK